MDGFGTGSADGRCSEAELVGRLRAGDREALREAYERHAGRLLNLAWRILLDRDDAEDLVQDLFVGLAGRLEGFRGESGLGTWLHRVATNDALALARSRGRRRSLLERFFAPESGREERRDPAGARDAERAVRELLGRFDPETRAIFWMREAEELDVKSVAEALGLPEGTVKSRLSRAKAKALRHLKEAGHGRIEDLV
ncbi:MAG: RNA polymerase sigma factor [Fibrobacterales bacterium]|nr:RNA polymerase sigma factor [Fibrobacterales bacterium]